MNRLILTLLLMFLLFSCNNATHNLKDDTDFLNDDGAVSDADTDEADKLIYDVKVSKNEKNSLSCFVTLKTQTSVRPKVQYFKADGRGYEIEADNEGTEHEFFLWGMKAQTEYVIEIYLEDELHYTTGYISGSLPDTVPEYEMTIKDAEKVSEGFLLFTTSATKLEEVFPTAIMVDTDGDIVWYHELDMVGFASIGDLQYIEETQNVLIAIIKGANMIDIPAEEAVEIDLEGRLVWKSRESANVYYSDEESWHHIYNRQSDNSIAMLRLDLVGTTVSDKIVNVDRDYNIIWEWRYQDHFQPPACDPSNWCDWTHCNWVEIDKEENFAYLNSRHLSRFHKIDMKTGEVIWTMGKDGDFTVVTDIEDPWFEWAHAPKVHGGNKVIFYDNGTIGRGYSRVIEYEIDEVNMVATVNYVFDGKETDQEWFTEKWGDADPLPGGNIMVTASTEELLKKNRFFEITREGEIVWELTLKGGDDWKRMGYNSYKFISPLKKIRK